MPEERLQKILSQAGVTSRRTAEELMGEGRVTVNGKTVTELGSKADIDNDHIKVDGRLLRAPKHLTYIALNKPKECMTTVSDPEGRQTVMHLMRGVRERVFPVGRLDYHSEGLLLLTNDGELKRQLELPRTGVVRTYRARAFGHVTQARLEKLAEGITVEGIHYGSINANLERRTGRNCWIEMSLTEGKNREVRRVLAHLDLQVSRLIRTAYGPLTLHGLEPGNVDEVRETDLQAFRNSLK
jgi:23S rRNA pseudouridine2605 synthase